MKLIDAIKEKGRPYWIPDCSRDDLPEFFKELGFKIGVEIGVLHGENLRKYCDTGLTMYGIDPWTSYSDFRTFRSIEEAYNNVVKNFSSYPNCNIIRKMSMDAVNDFSKRSLDFVYIDGNHQFGYAAMDLMKWTDKVKRGGIVAGHDYFCYKGDRKNRFVGPVVDAYVKSYDIENYYILGRKEPVAGEKMDESLSFMFFKHW